MKHFEPTKHKVQWKLICQVDGKPFSAIYDKFSELQTMLNKLRKVLKVDVTQVIICEV